jgi:apolipoprotein N-acyltransferase
LVPFGEYVPFRWLLPLGHIASERFDLAVGPGPETIALPNLPSFAPVICYEAIFPHAVLDEGNRPGWIINVTNDAWFGRSIGPLQHFAIARVRAVEEGMPLARSANGGISAMFDPHGRALGLLPLGKQGVIDVTLPRASWLPTPYARWGDIPVLGFVLAALLAARLSQTPRRDS